MRDKLVYMHFFIFSFSIVTNLCESSLEVTKPQKELTPKDCRIYIAATIFDDFSYIPNLMMIMLLIYMTEKMTAQPLQDFWKHILKQMEKSEQSNLLSLDGHDSEEAIKRYNETASKNADQIILNILNNLTVS